MGPDATSPYESLHSDAQVATTATPVLDTAQRAVAAGRINAADWDLLRRKAVIGRHIAELTDLEPGAARTAIFRARSTLRTLV